MFSERRPSMEDEQVGIISGPVTVVSSSTLRHYQSTPHLDTFRTPHHTVNNYRNNEPPVMSTFSTFSNKNHKSGMDLRYRDDPNPYSVSTIDDYRVQVQDPYRAKSTVQLNKSKTLNHNNARSIMNFYTDEDDISHRSSTGSGSGTHRMSGNLSTNKFYPSSEASNNSGDGGYEIPDPDYEGSTGDSSEDLPLPTNLPILSDSSEEYSQLSLSATSTSGGPSPSPVASEPVSPTRLTENERMKVEYSLRGRKTWIYVSDSLANLYCMTKMSSSSSRPNSISSGGGRKTDDWVLKYTGVPVLLLDMGETKSRDKRKIQIVLAELGSGLALWKDTIDNLTSYRVVETNPGDGERSVSTFHTMHMSSDHTRLIGLSFDNPDTADKFAQKVDKLTSDFANISLSGSKSKKRDGKDAKAKKPPKYVRPKKSDISQPCGFQHVSSMSQKDKNLFSSLQHFVTPKSRLTSPSASEELSF